MKSYYKIIQEIANPNNAEPIEVDVVKLISEQQKIPVGIVRKGIKQGQFKINGSVVRKEEIQFRNGLKIKFGDQDVAMPTVQESKHIEKFIKRIKQELGIYDLDNIAAEIKSTYCCYLIEYFSDHNYDQTDVQNCEFADHIFLTLEGLFKDHFRENEKSKIPKRKELIEALVKFRSSKFNELAGLRESLSSGMYNNSLYKFLQDYTKIAYGPAFTYCIAPLLSHPVYGRPSIEALIKPIQDAQSKIEVDEQFNHWEKFKDVYANYSFLLDKDNLIHKSIYNPIHLHLHILFKKECKTVEIKNAVIELSSTPRKYNFSNANRSSYDLLLNIKNTGEGLAREIYINAQGINFSFEPFSVGILKPGEARTLTIEAKIQDPLNFHPQFIAQISWLNTTNEKQEASTVLFFHEQDVTVPWEELERNKPYTIQEIEEREKLYGRDEILDELKANILSTKVESFKIWGQKRVGKSSIVKTLKNILDDQDKIIIVWRKISGLVNVDPEKTLNNLGNSLCTEIFEEIGKKSDNLKDKDKLKDVEVPSFDGSLYPLEEYIKKLRRINSSLKFIFILDEFDGINVEFFLPGRLGDTLSQNMGKGLNENNYIGFLLVGSENMHLLDRQIMNYNNFKELEVDTFDKETQFDSFGQIISGPVAPHIKYSQDSIERIYNVTNGNPYFANLICSHIFRISSKNRDNEVDINITNKAIGIIVNSSQKSHFDHFWSDGIESDLKKERKTDIRKRILVAYSFSHFQTGEFPSRNEIVKNFKKPLEYPVEQYEIENTINEFLNRKIFYEEGRGIIRIKPSLFESWLCGPGRTLMIEGVSDLEALQKEKELEQEYSIKDEELKRLSETLIFRGNNISPATFQKFFNQFGSPIEQRRVFKLFDCIYYLSKQEIHDFFKKEQKTIFGRAEIRLKMGAKTIYREGIELYSFSETLNENIILVETFKAISHIRSTKTLKDFRKNKDAWKTSESDEVIIFESVIDDFESIKNDLISFLEEKAVKEKTTVRLVTLVITTRAKTKLIKATSPFANFSLVHYKELDENKLKPFVEGTQLFETSEEARFAFAEVRKQFNNFNKESLNVLFEDMCPGKSLPILWCETKSFTPLFKNEFAKQEFLDIKEENEALRTRVYHANRELSQALNAFIVTHLKEKVVTEKKSDWFHVDFIPQKVLTDISTRWISEGQKSPKESYFDFIHYKEIIRVNPELQGKLLVDNRMDWCERLNILRRDSAHPEKPAPSLEDVEYFEKVKTELLKKMSKLSK